jgi:hypothetical protein
MSKTMVLVLLFALLLPFIASLPSLLFIKACKNTNIKDPNKYCIGIRNN